MSFDHKLTIDGYRFRLIKIYDDHGVLVPDEADLDDQRYIDALKKGQQALRAANLIEFLNWNINYQSPKSMEMNECYSVSDIYTELEKQTYFALPKDAAGYIERVRHQLDTLIVENNQRIEKSSSGAGYVYLLRGPDGTYKIGKTKNPDDRRRTFNVKLPFRVEYVTLIETNDMTLLESDLHKRFKHKNVDGEWFNLDDDDVEYIKRLVK